MTHRTQSNVLLTALTFLVSSVALAQAPAAKPANATGQCKDGSYSTAASKSGACRGHNGVKDWYAAAVTPPAPAAPAGSAKPAATVAAPHPPPVATAKAPTPAATVKPTPVPAPPVAAAAAKPAAKGPKGNLANTPQAPGGGPGLVWVNTSSNVYHCSGTDFYGKTKVGSYMSESDAKAKGARPDHGNACSK